MSVTINGRKATMEEEKQLAIEMWQYVKELYMTHPGVYRHPAWMKTEFCISYKNKTGQQIDWKANCILCEKFHAGRCCGCPLDSDSRYCDYYFKLSDPEFPFHMRPAICDRIIEAIKSFKG